MKNISDALNFMMEAHADQVDKAGEPYWLHPLGVSTLMPMISSTDELIAALLHDVIEDTKYTAADLLSMGYSPEAVDMIKIVSRDKDKIGYHEWIREVMESGNSGAIKVKIADIKHNLLPERMKGLDPKFAARQKERYEWALPMLKLALMALGDAK